MTTEKELEARFTSAKTIPGTHKFHRFIPLDEFQLSVFDISNSVVTKTMAICERNVDAGETSEETSLEISLGVTYVACVYDNKWWIGIVKDKSEDYNDYFISFMKPSGEAKQYCWPAEGDNCWIDKSDIICTLPAPNITSSSTRGFSFSKIDIERIKNLFHCCR